MVLSFLDAYREAVIAKLDGLDEQQARWKPLPAANSLLGLVKHLAYVEQWWFHECFLGLKEELPWDESLGDDQDFIILDHETVAAVVALYRTQYARSNEIAVAAPSLDDGCLHPKGVERGVTVRWILQHMLEETARHAGHADITRELLDGTVDDS